MSTAPSRMRISVACHICTMYIVFFLKQMSVKTFLLVWRKKIPDVTDCNDFDNLFSN